MMVSGDGKGRALTQELLDEGQRLAKAGLAERAVAVYQEARQHTDDPVLLARAWRLEAFARQARGEWSESLEAARTSARLAREAEDRALLAEALNAEAAVHYGRGAFDQAIPLFEQMLGLTDLPRVRGLALQNLGISYGRTGELDRAEARLEEALGEFERAGYSWGQAHVLNNRVGIALEREDYERAEALAHEAVGVARQVDDLDLVAVATLNYAEALAGLGDLDRAEDEASTALGYFQTAGNRWRRIGCYELLGDLSARRGESELARRFWTDALRLARELGAASEAEKLEARLDS